MEKDWARSAGDQQLLSTLATVGCRLEATHGTRGSASALDDAVHYRNASMSRQRAKGDALRSPCGGPACHTPTIQAGRNLPQVFCGVRRLSGDFLRRFHQLLAGVTAEGGERREPARWDGKRRAEKPILHVQQHDARQQAVRRGGGSICPIRTRPRGAARQSRTHASSACELLGRRVFLQPRAFLSLATGAEPRTAPATAREDNDTPHSPQRRGYQLRLHSTLAPPSVNHERTPKHAAAPMAHKRPPAGGAQRSKRYAKGRTRDCCAKGCPTAKRPILQRSDDQK